ncbi:hypothetical protein [Blautia glucerasea]|uniref:hypothetical protein n=1 Tax=Blautia glucerasea TaxID=536633 RepID=UPI00156F3BB9|nr:hypothetical protein [Blautia glucerasea]NSJ26695.1 hypothetical protein [Blautia glucerasea]
MVIRSQDKSRLINFDNIHELRFWECEQGFDITDCVCPVGHYSSKEKALKVLDMIQEAYAKYETIHTSATGLATMSLFIESTNEVNELYMKIQNVLEKAVVFQMPEDLEVEA